MKSLISGGAGFLGSHVTRHLLEMGHKVMILDDLSGGFEENIPRNARFQHGSILNVPLIETLFQTHKFDYVFHLAAYAAENLSHFIKRFNYENNLIGSVNLINAAVNYEVKRFVFTSSIAVYGDQMPPFHEDMTCLPCDPYGVAKLAVECELRITHEMFGLDYTIFRPHNIYGPNQNISDRYRNVVGIFMNQCLQYQPMTIFGDGEQMRAFSYIGDVAGIIASAPNLAVMRNETYNIGGDTPTSINDLAGIIGTIMDSYKMIRLPEREEVKIAYCDHAKLKSVTSPFEMTHLMTGLKKMAEWAKQHGSKPCQMFRNIEIEKNFPEAWK